MKKWSFALGESKPLGSLTRALFHAVFYNTKCCALIMEVSQDSPGTRILVFSIFQQRILGPRAGQGLA